MIARMTGLFLCIFRRRCRPGIGSQCVIAALASSSSFLFLLLLANQQVVLFVCSLGPWLVRMPSGRSPMAALAMRLAAGRLGTGCGNARATSQRSQQHCAHMSANFRTSHFATRIDEP